MVTVPNQVVIIGNGSAALAALEAIHSTDSQIKSKLVSEEDYPAYSPTALPYLFAGRIDESQFFLRAESYYQEQNAQLLLSRRVERVLPGEKKVILAGGETLKFDKLLIATGASPVVPGIKGLNEVGYFVFKTLENTKALMAAAEKAKSAVVLGGGLVGMETASGLIKRGLKVTVVEKEARILPLYFDQEASELIKMIYVDNGVRLISGQEAIEVIPEKGDRRLSLRLSGGEKLATDLLVVAVGMAANLGLVKDSGIEVNRGILVDENMRTNFPDIYAGGDVAEAKDFFGRGKVINAILPDAVAQGRVAGISLAGGEARYAGAISFNIFNFFERSAFSCGLALAEGPEYKQVKRARPRKERYRRLVFKDGKLAGATLINEAIDPGIILHLIRNRVDLSEIMAGLEADLLNFGRYAMIKSETPDLP